MTLRLTQTDLKILSFSSLPNHDAKGFKGKENKNKEKNQGQTALERVRAQKYQKITNYMMHEMNAHMMHALMH